MTIGTIVYTLAGATFLGALAWAAFSYFRAEKAPARLEAQGTETARKGPNQ